MHPYISNLKKILDRTGITSVYPSFLKEIECYDDYFSNHSLLTELGPHANGVFQTVINDQHNHRLFSLEWDINRILRDLDSTSIQAAKVPIDDERLFCDESKVYHNTVQSYVRTHSINPILLVWLEFTKRYHIIDGNHRYVACKLRGQETVDAIILPARFHLKYMLSDESRMRYKIFHNLATIGGGIYVGQRQIDDNNYIYPITGNRIELGIPKRYLCLFLLWINNARKLSVEG